MVQDKGKLVHAHPANELTEKQFGFESVICKDKYKDAGGSEMVINSDVVPTGKIWKITYITAVNLDGDIATSVFLQVNHDGGDMSFHMKVGSTAQLESVDKHVELYLDAGDYIRIILTGIASPETCYLNIFGYEMNAP